MKVSILTANGEFHWDDAVKTSLAGTLEATPDAINCTAVSRNCDVMNKFSAWGIGDMSGRFVQDPNPTTTPFKSLWDHLNGM